MSIRPATHAGSWYSANKSKLKIQLDQFFSIANGKTSRLESVKGARVLIGPHAGYTYSGQRLAETFNVWDKSDVERVFILGPSHHVYFEGYAMLTQYDYYETPLGNLKVDSDLIEELIKPEAGSKGSPFKLMSSEVDQNEHSFEMHAPFLYYATEKSKSKPKLIPIMISAMNDHLCESIVERLLPYFLCEENTFIISSDFCHWGSRFGYTAYLPEPPNGSIQKEHINHLSYRSMPPKGVPIYESIQNLDTEAMRIASLGSYKLWRAYISETQNTICGQKPIGVVLRLLEALKEKYPDLPDSNFAWIGYSQSGRVTDVKDSSVSYASGYVQL